MHPCQKQQHRRKCQGNSGGFAKAEAVRQIPAGGFARRQSQHQHRRPVSLPFPGERQAHAYPGAEDHHTQQGQQRQAHRPKGRQLRRSFCAGAGRFCQEQGSGGKKQQNHRNPGGESPALAQDRAAEQPHGAGGDKQPQRARLLPGDRQGLQPRPHMERGVAQARRQRRQPRESRQRIGHGHCQNTRGGQGAVPVPAVRQQSQGHLDREGAEIISQQKRGQLPAPPQKAENQERAGKVHQEMGGTAGRQRPSHAAVPLSLSLFYP